MGKLGISSGGDGTAWNFHRGRTVVENLEFLKRGYGYFLEKAIKIVIFLSFLSLSHLQ